MNMSRRSSVMAAILLRTLSCAGIVGNAFTIPPLHVRSIDVVSSLEFTRSTGVGVRRRQAGVHRATQSELDKSAEYVKAELARVEAEYEEKRKAKILEQTKQAAAKGDAAVTPLADLDFIPYIDGEGMVTNLDTAGVKASVYAVYDESKSLQYIGVSRGIHQSLRLHLGRHPKDTYYFKVQHFARPSRSLLEVIKDSWIEENGCSPSGNDGGECQASWENPINIMPLLTEEDRAFVAAKKEKGKEEMGIKTLARRFEGEIVKVLEERAIKESMYFDPKLKGKGLLDLLQEKPDTSVPKN